MTRNRLCLALVAILFLVSCTPDDTQSPVEVQATAPPQPTETAARPVDAPTSTMATADPAPTNAPTIVESTATSTSEPTEVPDPEMTEAPEDAPAEVAVNGRTEDGAYFLGRADAPVTIIDYSDFL